MVSLPSPSPKASKLIAEEWVTRTVWCIPHIQACSGTSPILHPAVCRRGGCGSCRLAPNEPRFRAMIEKPAGTTQVHVSLRRQAPVRRDLAVLTKGVNSFVYEGSSLP